MHFGAEYKDMHTDYTGQGVHQLADCIDKIINNPDDRRIVINYECLDPKRFGYDGIASLSQVLLIISSHLYVSTHSNFAIRLTSIRMKSPPKCTKVLRTWASEFHSTLSYALLMQVTI